MFDALRDIMRTIGAIEPNRSTLPHDDVRTASAALLFHIIDADGVVTDDERATMRQVLSEEFDIDAGEAERLAAAGQAADEGAVDLFHFTSVLKNRLEEEDRIRFVEMLWDVTYADGEVHELEDNLIWRVADLLGVSTRDRMLMKREAATRSGVPD